MNSPKWTVFYNITSKESSKWIGTGWEFFDHSIDAIRACERLNAKPGHCASIRPFHPNDRVHLGAVHLEADK